MAGPELVRLADYVPSSLRPRLCEKCPNRTRTCANRGPVDSPFVIVGESPGKNEIIKGLPFVGESGIIMQKVLKESPVEPYYTNAFICMPRGKEKTLQSVAAAAQCCHNRLIETIKAHPRKVILALGNAALWSLTGDYSSKISAERGRIIPSPLAEYGIVACLHPAALLRGFGSSRLFKRDVSLARDLVKGDSPYRYKETACIEMETESDIRDLIDLASASDVEYIAADLETTGFSPREDYILSHGFCIEPDKAYIVPPHLAHLVGPMYNPSVVTAKYIWHNGKFDVGMLRGAFDKEHVDGRYPSLEPFIRHNVATRGQRWGYQFAATHEDTMLLSYCIDEVGGIHGLEVVGNDYLSAPNWKGVIEQYLPKKGASYANVPPEVLYLYQAKDLGVTRQVFPILRQMVASDPMLERLYTEHLLPSSETLTWIESNGVCADQEVIARNDVTIKSEIEHHLKIFQDRSEEVVGFRCNPNSWQQVQKFFYRGGLDIADGKILATDAKTLQAFPETPEVKLLQNCRETIKLYGQYVEGMRNAIESDGRIHTTYLLHGTTTGRLASRNPNLQNIVRDNRIKDQFRAADGRWLLSNDLSQAELRVLACLSGDKALCDIFTSGVSIHPIVAERFYGANYTEDQYQLAKAVTFGIVYGRDAFSIALEYQITVKEAQAYIDNWFGQFPDAKKFISACRNAPLFRKILKTPWGRKRRFGIIGRERIHDVGNQAANFPEQSMASDITLESANNVRPTLQRWGVKIVNLVHDDIIKEIPQDENLMHDIIKVVHKEFKTVPMRRGLTRVPFEAEWKAGTHWGSLVKPKNWEAWKAAQAA